MFLPNAAIQGISIIIEFFHVLSRKNSYISRNKPALLKSSNKHRAQFQPPYHCVKSVCIWSFSGPYFPALGLNTGRYGVFFCIQPQCGKTRTRKTPNIDTLQAVYDSECNAFCYSRLNSLGQ